MVTSWVWILTLLFMVATTITLTIALYKTRKISDFYHEKWQQWEHEYYLLRTSPAVDKENYFIRLSWLPVGDEDAIQHRPTIDETPKQEEGYKNGIVR